jgi:hypothetical protein
MDRLSSIYSAAADAVETIQIFPVTFLMSSSRTEDAAA